MTPLARQEKLLIQEVGDELVVYDQERRRAHRLNRTSALVWRYCDGQTTIAGMASLLQNELNLREANEGIVWLALDRLSKSHLLESVISRQGAVNVISRRETVRRLALAGAAAVLLPVVTSIVVPTAAHAASPPCSRVCGIRCTGGDECTKACAAGECCCASCFLGVARCVCKSKC